MTTLILTEKPSQAREFAAALKIKATGTGAFISHDYTITWAIGHLLTPKDPHEYDGKWKRWKRESLPMIPKVFSQKPVLKTISQFKTVINLLKSTQYKQVIVATDAGREGELIARSLIHHAAKESAHPNRIYLRFWSSEALTSQVILQGLKECRPLSEYDGLFMAARARQCADWLVGMNLTRLMSLVEGDLYSVGRVQTAVLGLIYRRTLERENFQPDIYFQIIAPLSDLETRYFHPDLKPETHIPTEELAERIFKECQGKDLVFHRQESTSETQGSPMLYSLTELQQAANRIYGFSASKTLSIAQRLYEKYKCLSYPRTDSKVLGTKTFPLVAGVIEKLRLKGPELFTAFDQAKLSPGFRKIFNNEKLTDHHALIPLKPMTFSPQSDDGKIFELVVRRFIQGFSKDAKLHKRRLEFKADQTVHFFQVLNEEYEFLGWKALDHQNSKPMKKLDFQANERFKVRYELAQKKTNPPPVYNEAALLKDMTDPSRLVQEKTYQKVFKGEVGLGTQATRAQIIETLLERNYISRQKRDLLLEEKGRNLIQLLHLKQHSKLMTEVESTAYWELKLQALAEGRDSAQDFLKGIHQLVVNVVAEWAETPCKPRVGLVKSHKYTSEVFGPCPVCQKGEVKLNQKAYYCSLWKETKCSLTIWKKIAGKTVTPSMLKQLLHKGETTVQKGFRSKDKKRFSGKLKLNGGKVEFDFPSPT